MPSPDHSSSGSSSDSDKQLALTSATTFEETEIENEHSFELILKSYSGYTKRLAEELAGSDAVEYKEGYALPVKKIKLLVEGPYGAGVRLEGFQSGSSRFFFLSRPLDSSSSADLPTVLLLQSS